MYGLIMGKTFALFQLFQAVGVSRVVAGGLVSGGVRFKIKNTGFVGKFIAMGCSTSKTLLGRSKILIFAFR